MVSKLEALFKQTFGARKIMEWARQLGAVVRLRRIHPQMFCLSLVACALGDETRSIATARRFFARLTGFSPEESSFYDRFTEAMVALLRYMYRSALSVCTTVHRAQLAAVLGRAGLADMLAIDSTQILLPASAKDSLPSTVGTKRFRSGLLAFEQALWREGRNPNPGRPYSSTRYALDVLNDA